MVISGEGLMKTIPCVEVNGILKPSTKLPTNNVVLVVCDGVNYVVYEKGDTIPQSEEQGE
jgi:hypothetical protein